MAESPPDAPTTVDELLALHKLEAYQKAFDDAGLDDLQELLAVTDTDGEFLNIVSLVGLKPGHIGRLRAALKLPAQVIGGSTVECHPRSQAQCRLPHHHLPLHHHHQHRRRSQPRRRHSTRLRKLPSLRCCTRQMGSGCSRMALASRPTRCPPSTSRGSCYASERSDRGSQPSHELLWSTGVHADASTANSTA